MIDPRVFHCQGRRPCKLRSLCAQVCGICAFTNQLFSYLFRVGGATNILPRKGTRKQDLAGDGYFLDTPPHKQTMLSSPATPRVQTSFLIPNLHCPTCVSHVTTLIHELDPAAVIRNISIVNHIVTIVHGTDTSITSIQSALTSNGYEVFDTIRELPAYQESPKPAIDTSRLRKAVQRWTPRRLSSTLR